MDVAELDDLVWQGFTLLAECKEGDKGEDVFNVSLTAPSYPKVTPIGASGGTLDEALIRLIETAKHPE